MKRILSLVLVLVLSFGLLAGCGDDTTDTSSQTSSNTSSEASSNASSNVEDTSSKLTEEQIKMTRYLGTFSIRIDEIKQKTEGKFTFGLQSDNHHYDVTNLEKGRNLAALSHFVDFDFIGNLGDLIHGAKSDDTEKMRICMDDIVGRYLDNANCPVMLTIGNHDNNEFWGKANNDYISLITPEEQHTRVFGPLKQYNGDKMIVDGDGSYYYMDFPEDNIRVIVLNTSNGAYDGTGFPDVYYLSEKQVNWFKNEALNTKHDVIVMSHVPMTEALPDNYKIPDNSDLITGAVEEFVANGGNFITYISGHLHSEDVGVDENGRLHIVIKNGGAYGSVFSVDREQKLINLYGLGGAKDRVFDYAEGRELI